MNVALQYVDDTPYEARKAFSDQIVQTVGHPHHIFSNSPDKLVFTGITGNLVVKLREQVEELIGEGDHPCVGIHFNAWGGSQTHEQDYTKDTSAEGLAS